MKRLIVLKDSCVNSSTKFQYIFTNGTKKEFVQRHCFEKQFASIGPLLGYVPV